MKVIPSVLFSELSGKAGTVVAARWKGQAYVRRLVTPANPNTALQQEQRGYMTQVVSWWHDLEDQLQEECDRLVLGLIMSGFNGMVKRNVKDLADEVDTRMIPLNADINPVSSDFTTITGTGSKLIACSWSLGEATGTNKMYFLAAESVAGVPGNNLFLSQKETTLASALGCDLTMPEGATEYMIWALVELEADSTFSIARVDVATSDAA